MELDIRLTRADFRRFLAERSGAAALGRISLAVGALAIAGALGVILLRGWQQGWALLLLGLVFLCWEPFLVSRQAGKLYRQARGMWQLHYSLDKKGMTIAPPDGRPRTVGWDEVIGTFYGRRLVVIYKDAGHAYLLPRRQLPAGLEELVRQYTPLLSGPPA